MVDKWRDKFIFGRITLLFRIFHVVDVVFTSSCFICSLGISVKREYKTSQTNALSSTVSTLYLFTRFLMLTALLHFLSRYLQWIENYITMISHHQYRRRLCLQFDRRKMTRIQSRLELLWLESCCQNTLSLLYRQLHRPSFDSLNQV